MNIVKLEHIETKFDGKFNTLVVSVAVVGTKGQRVQETYAMAPISPADMVNRRPYAVLVSVADTANYRIGNRGVVSLRPVSGTTLAFTMEHVEAKWLPVVNHINLWIEAQGLSPMRVLRVTDQTARVLDLVNKK